MGLLSKLIKKTGEAVVDPKPVEKPFQQKKITNPLVRKRRVIEPKKKLASDVTPLEMEMSESGSKGLPPKLGQLYSPIKSTIEQIQTGKQGVKGENLAKRVKDSAPNVSGSEKNFANIQLEPKKRYTQKELLDLLEGKVDDYDVRFRSNSNKRFLLRGKESEPRYAGTQRQQIEDKELDYFELTVHSPNPLKSEVENVTSQHFGGGVVAHARVSIRQDPEGKRYLLIEESQSDAARMAGVEVDDFDYDYDFRLDDFDEYPPEVQSKAAEPDFELQLSYSVLGKDELSIGYSDSSYVRQLIAEDPILGAAVTNFRGNVNQTITRKDLQAEFEDIEKSYKRQPSSVLEDARKYFKDLEKEIEKDIDTRYFGKEDIEVQSPLDAEGNKNEYIDVSKFPNKDYYDKYKQALEDNGDYLGFGGAINDFELPKFDDKKAEKNAKEIIKTLKDKYKFLKEDKLFNYDFLISQDANTLYRFSDIGSERLGTEKRDPVNRIFSYALSKDFLNYADDINYNINTDDTVPFGVSEKQAPTLKRLIEKAVSPQFISTSINQLSDNVFIKNLEVKNAKGQIAEIDARNEMLEEREPEVISKGKKVLYEKNEVPINSRMEIMLSSLKSAIILAKKEGIDEIVVPSAREIAKLRGDFYDDAFEKLYTDGLRKALNQLQQDTKGNIKVGTRVLRHDPDGAGDADLFIDDKPMYDKDKYRESFATSINIRELLFDPDTEALRFNMGGSVPPRALISDDAKREALLAGININRMMP